jgi:hypothetical protein
MDLGDGEIVRFNPLKEWYTMISKIEGQKVHLVFDIGEYHPEVMDFLTLLDVTSKSKATDEDIEALPEEIKRNWWKENKESLLGESKEF